MSIANLLAPNDYVLYCADLITQNGSSDDSTTIVLPQQTFIASPAIGVTTSTFRGVEQTPGDFQAPPITATIIKSDDITFVTLCLPQWFITANTGSSAVTSMIINSTLPANLQPQYTTTQIISCQATTGSFPAMTLTLTTAGQITITGQFGAAPFGTTGDIYLSFTTATA